MIKGEKWDHLVPEIILPLIEKYKGVERIKQLNLTDEI